MLEPQVLLDKLARREQFAALFAPELALLLLLDVRRQEAVLLLLARLGSKVAQVERTQIRHQRDAPVERADPIGFCTKGERCSGCQLATGRFECASRHQCEQDWAGSRAMKRAPK